MSCEVECLSLYSCGALVTPQPGAILGPYVKIGFGGEGQEITVGNKSSAPDHHAVIKSFEYGFSNGAGIKVEIFDEEGSRFKTFVERLNKALARANDDYTMFCEFGWIRQDCNGNVTLDKTTDYGGMLHFLPIKIETAYEQGKIKYTLEGADFQDRIAENRIERNQGREDNKIPLKQALRRLFQENEPRVLNVLFQRADGSEWCFKNADGGCEGPKAVWPADQQNALATARKWIAPLSTSDDKGIILQWNPAEDTSTIVFLEDPKPAPGESPDCCKRNIGTYIVNGGNCSPVLSFNPTINWNLGGNAGSGGGQPGAASGGGVKQEGREGLNVERVGSQTSLAVNQNDNMWRPNDQILPKAQDAHAHHEAAVRFREVPQSITADLKIQGDPKLAFPLGSRGLVGKTVSIIVINPFHVMGGENCEWIANPVCNETLSNKKWEIISANHQIKEGSYVTILKVFLEVPNVDIDQGEPLGGNGCGTQRFDNDRGSAD